MFWQYLIMEISIEIYIYTYLDKRIELLLFEYYFLNPYKYAYLFSEANKYLCSFFMLCYVYYNFLLYI